MNHWIMYVQNPENHDDQGIHLKLADAARPKPSPDEGFDAIFTPDEYAITDLASANRWGEEVYQLNGRVAEIVFI